jgi:translocation and assembly module TamA
MLLLRKRAERDIPGLLEVIKAQGYYAPQIEFVIDSDRRPIRVTYQMEPGPMYHVETIHVEVTDDAAGLLFKIPDPEKLDLEAGTTARASLIRTAARTLVLAAKNQGYPFATTDTPVVEVDHERATVRVSYQITLGPKAFFGPVAFVGNSTVSEEYLARQLMWSEGDLFRQDAVEATRERLLATRLFAVSRIKFGETLDDRGCLPLTIEVIERKHRTIKFGLGYSTDEGGGTDAAWEHRNLFGKGRSLRHTIKVSEIERSFESRYRIPDYRRRDQSLVLQMRVAEDDTDAFTSRNASLSIGIERKLLEKMKGGVGAKFTASDVSQGPEEDYFYLLSFPSFLMLDTSDNALEPAHGGRAMLGFTPFMEMEKPNTSFVRATSGYRHYLLLSKKFPVVLAGKFLLGTMAGASREDIPADERFYAGGGASIRGYAFQAVGPRSEEGPLGGRSLIEMSFETRYNVTERFGFVVFADGGNVFESSFPDFEESLQWGAGLGIRYKSPVGPLRMDVGVPINRRNDIDDVLQIYVSLGHAF